MCRLCKGDYPAIDEYQAFIHRTDEFLQKWSSRKDAAKNLGFIQDAIAIDSIRMNLSSEFGNPQLLDVPRKLIFNNLDPDEGLLLYVLCTWLDFRQKSERVWSTYLYKTKDWITDWVNKEKPRRGYGEEHLQKTMKTITETGSISKWIADQITSIASVHGPKPGNIYRFMGSICNNLLEISTAKTKQVQSLELGRCTFLGDYKRLWVLIRDLRRNNCMIRCLFERALNKVNTGREAVRLWYDTSYFDPNECQLPVDGQVLEKWGKIMNPTLGKPQEVALDAKHLADKYDISPSTFDLWSFK